MQLNNTQVSDDGSIYVNVQISFANGNHTVNMGTGGGPEITDLSESQQYIECNI